MAFIINGYPSKVFAMRLLVECPEKDASQKIIFLLETVQKNILKAWSSHKTKLCHRCLSNTFTNTFEFYFNSFSDWLIGWPKLQMDIVD